MRQQTEMMRDILTDKTAQKMIDYVSPIYGNSYVGLWLFQAMGAAMSKVCNVMEALREEANPATATLLLDQWEDHYGLFRDSSLTVEQRRTRLVTKIQSRGPCNPAKLAAAVSAALGGAKVEIMENVAKNTFRVIIRDLVTDIKPAIAVIERMKPAHLIYQISVATQMVSDADLKIAIALTHSVSFNVEEE